jgi:uncharacterized protein
MPVVTSYPGVYLEEIPSTSRTVTSVTTSATAFADFFARGPVGAAVKVTSFRDFTRTFGGLDTRSEASYGLYQYFNNGGSIAWVVRAIDAAAEAATFDVAVLTPTLADTAADAEAAANAARTAADEAATAAGEATGSAEAVLESANVAQATAAAAAATQSVADQTKKAASDPNAGDAASGMKDAAKSAADAAATARTAAQETSNAVAAVDTAEDQDTLKSLTDAAVQAAQGAAKAAQDAATAAQAAAKTVPKEVAAQGSINTAATAANDAAKQAKTAADAASKAQSGGSSDDASDEDSQAAAEELSKNVAAVATSTSQAASSTSDAAKAAAQASQELQIAIGVAGASSGKVATDAQTAAIAAAEAAELAADAAEAAQEAADAAAAADPADPEAKEIVERAVLAAAAAAKAAREASQRATAAQQASDDVADAGEPLRLAVSAANPGAWGNQLRFSIERTLGTSGSPEFQLDVQQLAVVSGKSKVVAQESYLNLTLDPQATRYAPQVVNGTSTLVRLDYFGGPVAGAYPADATDQKLAGGADGGLADAGTLMSTLTAALDRIAPDTFNILCLPATTKYSTGEANSALTQALEYCEQSRAFLVVDSPPSVTTVQQVQDWSADLRNAQAYSGAVYFPRLVIPDPLREYRPREIAPSGTVAGIYARTDLARGVWKAPAGIEAVIEGADLAVKLSDADSGALNPLGINVLRSFPIYGNVVWGARTLAGADQLQSEWKYVNVRRLTDYIEESLFQSLKWVVFEPNEELTWSQIRLQVNSFLAGLFAGGAFAGATPDQAFFVHCDATTTTPTDVDNGIVNIVVGFAPAKPAEFVILQIEQIAGQTAA